MKYFIMLSFLAITTKGFSTVYYADASSTSTVADGSFENPFKTLANVQNYLWSVAPGDTILFKRGEVFTGNLVLLSGGTSSNPIVLGAYGTGPKPIFLYDLANESSALYRWIVKIDNADYVYVENIEFNDFTMDSTVHNVDANVAAAVFITKSNNCIVRNIIVSNLGEGVILSGNHCLIKDNNMSHLRMIVNTPESNGSFGDDDFGAASVVITGSNNRIVNNHFEDNWGESYDYTFDGGGIEIYGSNSDNNQIMYNTVVECNGFSEVGGAETAWDNLYAYNLVINCTVIATFHLNGSFGSDIQRMRMFNNVFVETKKHLTMPSRLLGVGALNSSNAPDIVSLKNNIFYIKTDVSIAPLNAGNTYGERVTHENNIYFMNGGDLNYPIDASELTVNSSTDLFADTTNTNPLLWDYSLSCDSPAIDFGQDLQLLNDYAGTPIPNNTPNAGILEDNCKTPSSIKIEAEDYIAMRGVRVENTKNENPQSLNVGWINTGDWMDYNINIPSTGAYTINARVATVRDSAEFQFQIGDAILSTLYMSTTGAWQNWTTLSTNVYFEAGNHTLRILSLGNNFNINWFEITNAVTTTSAKALPSIVFTESFKLYPVPVVDELYFEKEDPSGILNIEIFDRNGKVVFSKTDIKDSKTQIDTSLLTTGLYVFKIFDKKTLEYTTIEFVK